MKNWVPWGDRPDPDEDTLSGKGFLIMVAVVILAGWLGFLPEDLGDRWDCSRSDKDVYRVKDAWEVTVRDDPPLGSRFNCVQYRNAATEWNAQCERLYDPFPVPERCDASADS